MSMSLSIQHVPIWPQLSGIVEKIWVFRSPGRLPAAETRLIVPNGMPKLVVPVRNGLTGTYQGWQHNTREATITLIGMADAPATVDMLEDRPHENIGIEFTALGAYRVFPLLHTELRNRIFDLADVLGREAMDLQDCITETEDMARKLYLLQSWLCRRALRLEPDSVLDHCLHSIRRSSGLVSVSELERQTGYSARWLNRKFTEKVGLGPKAYASVTRFSRFYEEWARTATPDFFRADMYEFFYDQAHFIREFRRFTGHSPAAFAREQNELGRLFYREG